MLIHNSDCRVVAKAHANGDVLTWQDIMQLVKLRAVERKERHEYCQRVMAERRVWSGLQDYT